MAKGYSLDALVNEHYIKDAVGLGDSNINDKWGKDNVGTFFQNIAAYATVENGYPAGASAGNLEVLLTSAGTLGNCIQRYTNFNDLRMWMRSQKGGDGDRSWATWRELINANNIYNSIYPIGIVLQFDNATNPNNMFTGTVWEQITDGRSARAATGPEAGTTAGQIGSVGGSDTATIAVANLPGHTHGMQNHTHGIAAHSHTMDHTHTINHDHAAVASSSSGEHAHSVSGSTSSAGDHTHSIGGAVSVAAGGGATINQNQSGVNTRPAGAHTHSISGSTNSTGAHAHTVDIPYFTGTSGGPSVGWTGGAPLTTGGPSSNETTSTGDGTALNVCNSVHYYAFWKRTA
ncbi:putative tail fiber protein [Escherichia phage flopper]|uniref:Putative tail fiber protein n=1 Tax=Escherichia phage flopper TaxID=2696397 RepID=A0A6B9WXP2_9CAUD|nr:putative tail fiber protein [Escherichia phage flopper]QHR68771.1 putative tail fiber protein [Escherichia phage flopper]